MRGVTATHFCFAAIRLVGTRGTAIALLMKPILREEVQSHEKFHIGVIDNSFPLLKFRCAICEGA